MDLVYEHVHVPTQFSKNKVRQIDGDGDATLGYGDRCTQENGHGVQTLYLHTWTSLTIFWVQHELQRIYVCVSTGTSIDTIPTER